jgi:hypothetical protein
METGDEEPALLRKRNWESADALGATPKVLSRSDPAIEIAIAPTAAVHSEFSRPLPRHRR